MEKENMRNKVYGGNAKTVFVVGDLHGDLESFLKILDRFKTPKRNSLLLFLGDYADRGSNGIEIITRLNRLVDTRKDIIALKGNHEIYRDENPMFSPCDLVSEAQVKYGSWKQFFHDIFLDFLGKLYIAAIINNVLFVHAGISSDITTAEDLKEQHNETVLLWSDPSPLPGEHPNMRGAGISFGEGITSKVLTSLGLKMLVRSHEPGKAAYGPYSEHDGKVITTNACTSYGEPWSPFVLKVDTESLHYTPIFLKT
jgi:hypothetical protein